MKYSKEAYSYAFDKISANNKDAEQSLEYRKNEIYSKIGRIKEIDAELAQTGAAVVKAAVSSAEDIDLLIEGLKIKNLSLQAEKENLLLKNGYSADYLKIKHKCELCSDTGYVNGKICKCAQKYLQEYSYKELNAVSSLEDSTFENFSLEYYSDIPSPNIPGGSERSKMLANFNYCVRYAKSFCEDSPSILMIGNTGLGKTHLSLAIVNEVIKKGIPVIYGSVLNLMNKIEREKFSQGNMTETLDNLLECPLLVLDDLGAEFDTSFSTSVIYNIINTRICNKKPVIINTNLSMSEMEQKYSQRIVSRIIGSYDVLFFYGNDVRQLKKQKKIKR